MDTKIKLWVQGLTNSQVQSGAYALVLAEENGLRRIPIIVGTSEAQSIAIVLEHITPPRPLTHDLFANLFHAVGVKLLEVFIYKFEEGVFYSELSVDANGKHLRIDSRTSDAIAIALRVKCDIYTTEKVMRECGVVLEEDIKQQEEPEQAGEQRKLLEPNDIKDEYQLKEWLVAMSSEELEKRLDKAVTSEDYEHAQLYKDELNRREGG